MRIHGSYIINFESVLLVSLGMASIGTHSESEHPQDKAQDLRYGSEEVCETQRILTEELGNWSRGSGGCLLFLGKAGRIRVLLLQKPQRLHVR